MKPPISGRGSYGTDRRIDCAVCQTLLALQCPTAIILYAHCPRRCLCCSPSQLLLSFHLGHEYKSRRERTMYIVLEYCRFVDCWEIAVRCKVSPNVCVEPWINRHSPSRKDIQQRSLATSTVASEEPENTLWSVFSLLASQPAPSLAAVSFLLLLFLSPSRALESRHSQQDKLALDGFASSKPTRHDL